MLYHLYEFNHAIAAPWRALAKAGHSFWHHPVNPISKTYLARAIIASCDVFERATRRYDKPEFGLNETRIEGKTIPIHLETAWSSPFCSLLHFRRVFSEDFPAQPSQKLLIVAPMSGHYATLLRGTVQSFLPHADVYITDWVDARQIPLSDGGFDFEDYVDSIIEMLGFLGPGVHVMAVCQPSVPTLVAASVMNEREDVNAPASMILMGGPIDTNRNPTAVNLLAQEKGTAWFERSVIARVPLPYPGMMRRVYPGFLQLTGFMTMNLDRHLDAHRDLFWHLVEGDGDSTEKHRQFYDEYLSVMDLCAEFYLQTVDRVFVERMLPAGRLTHRGTLVDPSCITRTALMTVEGERDDISGVGQTQAAHDLCSRLAPEKRSHHLQKDVGHYGVFNGRRFNQEIVPKILKFMEEMRTI